MNVVRNLLPALLGALLVGLLLVGCVGQPVSLTEAETTYRAAVQQATAQASYATQQAQQATAAAVSAQQATAQAIEVQVTQAAIQAEATRQALEVSIAATDAAQQAAFAATAAHDEAIRLAQQREAERIANERAALINDLLPLVAVVALLLALLVAALLAALAWRRNQPIVYDNRTVQVALPTGGLFGGDYRVLGPRTLPREEAPAVALLPETTGAPVRELPRLPQGHVLIAGETGSGKSTAARAVLAARSNVVVLDPHAAPGDWGALTVVGGGRDFGAIGQHVAQMSRLLTERYQERDAGRRQFDPITIAIDEMPAVVTECGRDVAMAWRMWLREGRKVGLYLVVMTHSTRVTTLGIKGEGDLLENFNAGVIELGQVARDNHPQLTQRMQRPAVLRTLHGARPIVIPYQAAGPAAEEPQDAPYEIVHVAPAPTYADPKNLSRAEQDRIRSMLARGLSSREIEQTIFGYTGGAAYTAVRDVRSATTIDG